MRSTFAFVHAVLPVILMYLQAPSVLSKSNMHTKSIEFVVFFTADMCVAFAELTFVLSSFQSLFRSGEEEGVLVVIVAERILTGNAVAPGCAKIGVPDRENSYSNGFSDMEEKNMTALSLTV